MTDILSAQNLSERDLITSILNSFYIVDYGYINKVNGDKTVNVTHAAKPVLTDGTELPETVTSNIEVLTLCGAGFCVQWDYKAGDKVLLLGLKSYVPEAGGVKQAEVPKAFVHYSRATLKAIPLCVFSDEAKVKILVENGKMTIRTDSTLELDGNDNGGVVIAPELKTQLGYLTQRVDTIINALQNAPTAAQDGGATYKTGISTILKTIVNKENFSNIESDKVKHGKGGD
nr:MAG TPA: hypothetical protein [Caudoviricetes sp.]